MDGDYTFTFKIDSFTPATLPMGRLAEYLAQLAKLYGEEERVHFQKLRKGSAVLVVEVEEPAYPKVWARLQNAKSRDADEDVETAYKAIDKLLRNDHAVGTIARAAGKVIEFPGRKLPEAVQHSVTQLTSVDGVVIRIGGRDETIPVTLRDQEGRIIKCQVRGAVAAKELSKHFLGEPLRITGQAKMVRYATGAWDIETLMIDSYELLDTIDAASVLRDIAAKAGKGWAETGDPLGEWRKIRGID